MSDAGRRRIGNRHDAKRERQTHPASHALLAFLRTKFGGLVKKTDADLLHMRGLLVAAQREIIDKGEAISLRAHWYPVRVLERDLDAEIDRRICGPGFEPASTP